jgi:lipopolysaccharide/colanic/teichoic acid biosynthesis glycosyltransferase
MSGPVFKIQQDPRVTRIGHFIRRTSIDELPQLFNVLFGDMSLVGPRPPIPTEVNEYESWQRRRLSVKPGLTGLWQVSGRNNIDFEEWMKLDLSYIDNWSLALDFKILLRTVPAVVTKSGAS